MSTIMFKTYAFAFVGTKYEINSPYGPILTDEYDKFFDEVMRLTAPLPLCLLDSVEVVFWADQPVGPFSSAHIHAVESNLEALLLFVMQHPGASIRFDPEIGFLLTDEVDDTLFRLSR